MNHSELELAQIYIKFITGNTIDEENQIVQLYLDEQNIDFDVFLGWLNVVRKSSGSLKNDILAAKQSFYGEYCSYGHFLVCEKIIPIYDGYDETFTISEELSQAMATLAQFFCKGFFFWKNKGKLIVYKIQ